MAKGTNDKSKKLLGELVRYGIVGVVSTAIDMGLLKISHNFMHQTDSTLWLATAVGFVGGTINGYYMNSRWTFRYNTEGQETKKFSQFTAVSLIGLALTEIIVLTCHQKFGLSEMAAKLVAVGIVFFWNYAGNKIWTFKK